MFVIELYNHLKRKKKKKNNSSEKKIIIFIYDRSVGNLRRIKTIFGNYKIDMPIMNEPRPSVVQQVAHRIVRYFVVVVAFALNENNKMCCACWFIMNAFIWFQITVLSRATDLTMCSAAIILISVFIGCY